MRDLLGRVEDLPDLSEIREPTPWGRIGHFCLHCLIDRTREEHELLDASPLNHLRS